MSTFTPFASRLLAVPRWLVIPVLGWHLATGTRQATGMKTGTLLNRFGHVHSIFPGSYSVLIVIIFVSMAFLVLIDHIHRMNDQTILEKSMKTRDFYLEQPLCSSACYISFMAFIAHILFHLFIYF